MFKPDQTKKAAIRKWYYKEVFFAEETGVVPFLVSFFKADKDRERGLITELSFKRIQDDKSIPERYHSMQNLGNLAFYTAPENIERIDACGAYCFGGKILPHRDILESSACKSFFRSFVFDFDLQNRSCECKSDKTTCEKCFKSGIYDKARSMKRALEKMNLIYERDFLIFFSGSRGFHLYITDDFSSMMTPEERLIFLDSISKRSHVPVTDAEISYKMNHMLRVPFSLHNATCLPALPLFTKEIRLETFSDLLKWSDFEENKTELKKQIVAWVERMNTK